MTMTFSKDKVKRDNLHVAMRNFRLHRATAVGIIMTLLLVEQICMAKDTVIVREKSVSVADVPNSKFYPGAGVTVTPSFYRLLEFHDNRGNRSHMFVGGKNILLKLHLDDLSLITKIVVPKYQVDFECEALQNSEFYCHNYVTFLQEINELQSVLCGTNYLTPTCVMFNTMSNTITGGQNWHAAGMSASAPDQNAMTSIDISGGVMTIYSGAPTRVEYNYAFSRSTMPLDSLSSTPSVVRTNTGVSTWIETSSSKVPSFIGDPIEYNGKIYFFFREEAVEAKNVAKVVYSRVGQVCANDPGGVEDGNGLFTTFLKARLSCATGGEFQMSFNYLRGIFRSPQNPNIIFGAFTTPESAFAASAVCAYDLAEIETLFTTSSFRGQKTGSSFWLNVPSNDVPSDPRPGECSKIQPFTSYDSFQLMSELVPNKADYFASSRSNLADMETSPPLILLQLYRFQQLVIQETAMSGLAYDIFFLGTSEGQILKAYIYDETPRIIDEILLNLDSDSAEAINVMKIGNNGTRIFASTSSRVYSVPTENCQRFRTCAECVSGQDPACSWETSGKEGCVASQDGIMDLENGDPNECPVASSTPTIQTNPATPASETTDQTPSSPGMTTGTGGKTPNSKLQTGECEEGPKMELNICYPWILSSVLLVCCCNIPTCIALFLSCKKRKKNYSPSAIKRNRDASQKVPLHSMERLNSDLDEEADELSPMTDTDNGSPHRHNDNSLHQKKNGQSVPLRIPSTGTPVRGTTVSASEA